MLKWDKSENNIPENPFAVLVLGNKIMFLININNYVFDEQDKVQTLKHHDIIPALIKLILSFRHNSSFNSF